MIKSIHIENFRSIQDLYIEPRQLCALIGPNSCGKTNILKAIDLVLGEGWTTKAKVARELFNDISAPINIKIELKKPVEWLYFKNKKYIRTITLNMTYEPLDCKVRLWEEYPEDKNGDGYYLNDEFKKSCHFIYLPSTRDLYLQMRVSNWTLLGKMMRTVYENYVEFYGDDERIKTEFKELMQPPREFLVKDFDTNKVTFHKFSETVKKYCRQNSAGLATNFDVDFDIYNLNWFYKTLQVLVSEESSEKQFDWEEVGSGMQNLILLSLFQTYGELMGGRVILAIEEPEVFLYPHAQRVLYKSFQELAQQAQIFYTTHNPNFVDAIRAHEIEILRKDPKRGSESLEKDAIITPEFLHSDEFRIYTQFNPERNEIFFANKILLVEGDSDRKLWEVLVQRKTGLDINAEGISIIECGGKGGVVYFLGVLKLLGIKEYFAVWDEDDDVKDRHGHLKKCLEERKGIEVSGNLEAFLSQRFQKFKFVENRKVECAYNWAHGVNVADVPAEFKPVFDFVSGLPVVVSDEHDMPF